MENYTSYNFNSHSFRYQSNVSSIFGLIDSVKQKYFFIFKNDLRQIDYMNTVFRDFSVIYERFAISLIGKIVELTELHINNDVIFYFIAKKSIDFTPKMCRPKYLKNCSHFSEFFIPNYPVLSNGVSYWKCVSYLMTANDLGGQIWNWVPEMTTDGLGRPKMAIYDFIVTSSSSSSTLHRERKS